MSKRTARRRVVLAIALVAAIASVGMIPAGAFDEEIAAAKVTRRGPCSGPSAWRLVLSKDSPDSIRIAFQVRGGKADQRWNVFVSDNGDRVFTGSRISGRDGFFAVRATTRNRDGRDKIRAGANNTVTGETCRGGGAI